MQFSVDVTGLEALAARLAAAGLSMERVRRMAINTVARKTMTRSRREIVTQVNLKASYVKERMTLKTATSASPVAVITARRRATRLATYGAKQVTRAARRAKGDSRRGIGPGRKQAGVSVSVKAGGSRKRMDGAFFMPLRAGQAAGGNGMGVFVRTGSGRKAMKHLYGPSVDQVFRGVAAQIVPDVKAELAREIQRLAAVQLKKKGA